MCGLCCGPPKKNRDADYDEYVLRPVPPGGGQRPPGAGERYYNYQAQESFFGRLKRMLNGRPPAQEEDYDTNGPRGHKLVRPSFLRIPFI